MPEQGEPWRMTPPGKVGRFGEYTAQGFRFDSLTGERAWWVSPWGDYGPVRSFWVSQGKFYAVLLRFYGGPDNHVETYEEIKDISNDEREAILEAVATWEAAT